MINNFRKEIKIPINKTLDLFFNNWKDQSKNFKRTYEDRSVRSIYYDTPNFRSAKDNLSGISVRKKYRIRWYNDENNLNYEIKLKKNNLGSKILYTSNNSLKNFKKLFSLKNLTHENNISILENVDSFNLEPKLKVSYTRSYYSYNNLIRITYDRNINYEKFDYFNIREKKIFDQMNVIEIKFDPKNLDIATELIQNSNFIPKRFSKYLRGLYLFGNTVYI